MDFNDFKVYFLSYLNESTVSARDMNITSKDFVDSVAYDCYRVYDMSGMDIDVICKIADNILFSVKRYSPILGK